MIDVYCPFPILKNACCFVPKMTESQRQHCQIFDCLLNFAVLEEKTQEKKSWTRGRGRPKKTLDLSDPILRFRPPYFVVCKEVHIYQNPKGCNDCHFLYQSNIPQITEVIPSQPKWILIHIPNRKFRKGHRCTICTEQKSSSFGEELKSRSLINVAIN